jgi:hypothetical protein
MDAEARFTCLRQRLIENEYIPDGPLSDDDSIEKTDFNDSIVLKAEAFVQASRKKQRKRDCRKACEYLCIILLAVFVYVVWK